MARKGQQLAQIINIPARNIVYENQEQEWKEVSKNTILTKNTTFLIKAKLNAGSKSLKENMAIRKIMHQTKIKEITTEKERHTSE